MKVKIFNNISYLGSTFSFYVYIDSKNINIVDNQTPGISKPWHSFKSPTSLKLGKASTRKRNSVTNFS